MLLLRTDKLPEGPGWTYEIKLDGYRALAFKKAGKVHLRSRNDNDFNGRYPGIVKALSPLPNDTVIDGEVVALDEDGRPSFNTLQNYGSAGAPLHFYVFDLLVLEGRDVTKETLASASFVPSLLTFINAAKSCSVHVNKAWTSRRKLMTCAAGRVVWLGVVVPDLDKLPINSARQSGQDFA